jgi:hypothetical protein
MIRESLFAATLLIGGNAADVTSTQALVRAGGIEAWNPTLYGLHAERIVPVKAAITAGEMTMFHIVRKKNKKLAWAIVVGITVANAYAFHHNQQVTRRIKEGR